ncbi:hypothetical protein [Pelagibius sp. 7325]|uniref:hypothetical protein n=1 Tax=Pelagibius sp. 7325 TaxID=3131994 RepID=UPI0030ED811B
MTLPQSPLRIANLLLLLVCLALGWTIHRQVEEGAIADAPGAVRPNAGQPAPSAPLPLDPSDTEFRAVAPAAYVEIVARSLFQRSRRPLPAAAAPAPSLERVEHLRLFLSGIVEDAGRKWAFVKVGEDPSMHRVAAGGSVAGWTVEAIGADSVTLMKEGETVRLAMRAGHRERGTLPPAGTGSSLGLPAGELTGIGRELDDTGD